MDAKKLKPQAYSRSDRDIRQIITSHVYNNAPIDFSDDHDGSKFEAFKRVFQELCESRKSDFDKEVAALWMDWGTREGFTII